MASFCFVVCNRPLLQTTWKPNLLGRSVRDANQPGHKPILDSAIPNRSALRLWVGGSQVLGSLPSRTDNEVDIPGIIQASVSADFSMHDQNCSFKSTSEQRPFALRSWFKFILLPELLSKSKRTRLSLLTILIKATSPQYCFLQMPYVTYFD